MTCLPDTVLLLLLLFSSHVHAVLYTFPAQYRLVFPELVNGTIATYTANVASLEACASQASAKHPSGFVTYDSSAKTCVFAATVNGFIYGKVTARSAAFVGTGVSDPRQLSPIETEVYLMEKVYASQQCPPTTKFDAVAGFCMTKMTNIRWGNYMAGRDQHNTIYVLPKSKVFDSLCYKCDTLTSVKMVFANKWFCYSTHPIKNPTYATISQNACKNLVPGSTVIKLTDKVKECGFINNIPDVSVAYLGIVLPAGAKKSPTAFKYYDGSNPNPLTWLPGRPDINAAHNLVYCIIYRAGSVADAGPSSLNQLICKKAAVKVACPAPPPCLPLNANDVGLTLCANAGNDGNSNPEITGECQCTSGVRQFMSPLEGSSPDESEEMRNYYGVRCQDKTSLCICREDGVCCTPGPSPPDRIEFMPFCDENAGPNSPYLKAESVCCDSDGCAPIQPENEVCIGPATPF